MKEMTKRTLAILVVIFLLTLIVLVIFRSTVQEIFIVPTLYLVWLANLIFNSIHQVIFWGILIFLAVVLLFRNLRQRPGFRRRRDRAAGEDQNNQRLSFWLNQMQINDGESQRDLYTLHEFRKLITSVWAYQLNMSPRELEQQLKARKIKPPPEWRRYFERDTLDETSEYGFFARLLGRVGNFFFKKEKITPSYFQLELESLIQSLEEQMEVHHDPGN